MSESTPNLRIELTVSLIRTTWTRGGLEREVFPEGSRSRSGRCQQEQQQGGQTLGPRWKTRYTGHHGAPRPRQAPHGHPVGSRARRRVGGRSLGPLWESATVLIQVGVEEVGSSIPMTRGGVNLRRPIEARGGPERERSGAAARTLTKGSPRVCGDPVRPRRPLACSSDRGAPAFFQRSSAHRLQAHGPMGEGPAGVDPRAPRLPIRVPVVDRESAPDVAATGS